MADDTEWHVVHTHKPHPPAPQPKNVKSSKPKSANKEKKKPAVKESLDPKKQDPKKTEKKTEKKKPNKKEKRKSVTLKKEDTKKEGQSSDSDTDEDEEGIEPESLPPYHTATFVSCPLEGCESPAPFLDTTSLTYHLKEHHQLVFKNLHHMYNSLDAYLKRWGDELKKTRLETFTSKTDGIYTLDPEKCSLDKQIREQLQKTKLKDVLNFQQHEREVEAKCPRKCLFCKIVGDNRTLLFKHMFSEHNFNIGLPDNLVYVGEFLDSLEAKLSYLKCLYCEKTFTSPAVLRKHMRKKKHFKIAAKNRQYDRFYVINYLEPGKNWESFEHDRAESEEEEKGEETWDDWEEEEVESTMCLFDTHMLTNPKETLDHMKTEHGFDLNKIRKEKELDFYQTIILINYIRHQSSLNTCFSCGTQLENLSNLPEHLKEKKCTEAIDKEAEFWKDPKYLMPTYENDPLLTGFEEDEELEKE
ncbi:hypothetical protein BY458DRAFT_501828 [Sporodiniella umbellata]|nr:hypothetical protein BY458DRAFT_501828 [Sporodiniella umbellata]